LFFEAATIFADVAAASTSEQYESVELGLGDGTAVFDGDKPDFAEYLPQMAGTIYKLIYEIQN
jgi:hypothetical protein